MAALAPRGLDPPLSLSGSVDEALGHHPAGGLMPLLVLVAVARRLNPHTRFTSIRAALLSAADITSAPPADPDRDVILGRVHHQEVPSGLTEGEALYAAVDHHHHQGPAGLIEGEALQVSSCTYAAVDHRHQTGGRPAGLPQSEEFQNGSHISAAFHHHQVGGRPAVLPEVEALQVGSRTCPAVPCCLDHAGGSKGLFDGKAFGTVRCCGSLLGIDTPDRDVDGPCSPTQYTTSGLNLSGMMTGDVEGESFRSIHIDEVSCHSDSEAEACLIMSHTTALLPPKKSTTLASQDGNGQRAIRPRSQGPMGGLPQQLIVKIAREVVKSSIRDATAMKLCCTLWNSAYEIQGPLLVVSRLYPDTPMVTPMKIVSEKGAQGQLVMKAVNWLNPPPTHNVCWGSAKGFLALRDTRNNTVCLHCPTCGAGRTLPDLPLNYVPKGAYLRGGNFLLAIMTDTAQAAEEDPGVLDDDVFTDRSVICLPRLSIDDGPTEDGDDDNEDGGDDEDDGDDDEDVNWTWGRYPGTEDFFPMRSVNFISNTTFALLQLPPMFSS